MLLLEEEAIRYTLLGVERTTNYRKKGEERVCERKEEGNGGCFGITFSVLQ